MKTYDVRVSHGVCTSYVIVHARSHDEAISEALLVLKVNYLDAKEILVVPRAS